VQQPYERALALWDDGSVDDLLAAFALLDELDARAVAAVVRGRLRELGVAGVPRGSSPITRANPGGLTDRQLDVLSLLVEGLSNADIAARLVISRRPPTTTCRRSSASSTSGRAARRWRPPGASGCPDDPSRPPRTGGRAAPRRQRGCDGHDRATWQGEWVRDVTQPARLPPGTDDGMAARVQAHDWSGTPVGPAPDWPQSLQTALSLLPALHRVTQA
jgi:hypothetical protein